LDIGVEFVEIHLAKKVLKNKIALPTSNAQKYLYRKKEEIPLVVQFFIYFTNETKAMLI
jgi:hypothetical protein